ncbi:hypothetical protein [Ammoniphilus sp. YIM 78166]|uniref:hypothetical protein n=1 Tax=Ammoniphilus sp. YIM 78166 TaxID=1644106 RepID=UPI00106F10D6|nr:hypothetical protein [Ammoniphilus sp. YIM 78166]
MKIDCRLEEGTQLAQHLQKLQEMGRGKKSEYIRNALEFYYTFGEKQEAMMNILLELKEQQEAVMRRLDNLEETRGRVNRDCTVEEEKDPSLGEGISDDAVIEYLSTGMKDIAF